MLVFRWLRALARIVLGVVMLAPVVAMPVAVLFDRGPAGDARISPHFFPLALWVFDDFAWACAGNSLLFAIVVSLASLVLGSALGWIVARRRFWGRGILYGLMLALLAVSPAFLAFGLGSVLGPPRPWPWPFSVTADAAPGVGLESWRGLPLWIEWIWTTLPWGVALVAWVTAAAVEQLEPSWADAARLAGAGAFRAWKALSWPLVRPSSARAAAVVFVFALAEPGAPLVLGLRRTLAFQIVETAGRPDPFPAAAVWAVMTGLFGLVGWIAWHWAAGARILEYSGIETVHSPHRPRPGGTSRLRPFILTLLLGGWVAIGWLPLAGLIHLMIGGSGAEPLSTAGALRAIEENARRLSQPPITRLLANSLLLGLEIALASIAVAWLAGQASRGRRNPHAGTRLARWIGCPPPLLQGAGLLGLSWLSGLGLASLAEIGGWRQLAIGLGSISGWLDPLRNPWIALSCCVALSVIPRFLWFWRGDEPTDPAPTSKSSARDAAVLAGASRGKAARLGRPLARGRWLVGALLVGSLAATNLTPALLFEPWIDVQTLSPAIVRLTAGPADARSQAAALALCAIAFNMAALAVARASGALPRSVDLE